MTYFQVALLTLLITDSNGFGLLAPDADGSLSFADCFKPNTILVRGSSVLVSTPQDCKNQCQNDPDCSVSKLQILIWRFPWNFFVICHQHWTFVVTGSPQGNSCGLRNYRSSSPDLISIPNQSQNIVSGDLINSNFNFGSIWVFKSSQNYQDKDKCYNWCTKTPGCKSAIFMERPLRKCVLNDFGSVAGFGIAFGRELTVLGSSYTDMLVNCQCAKYISGPSAGRSGCS